MPRIFITLQFEQDAQMAQKMISEVKSAVLSLEELNLKDRRDHVSVDISFTQKDYDFKNGHFIAEVTLDKRPERTKSILDDLAYYVRIAITRTLGSFEHKNSFGEVWTRTLDEKEEGFASTN